MKSKKADFNFVLLFAIIAGTAILLLSIYGAVKAGTSQRVGQSAELAKKIEYITDPLQAGFASTSSSSITFPKETRINNNCFSEGFGYNEIFIQSKSSIGEEWLKETIPTQINNKYIFSENQEGKKFYVLSKPFKMPFEIADLLFITSKDYCLIMTDEDAEEIAEEIISLGTKNIGVKTSENNTCSEDAIKVCFGYGSSCEITIIGECPNCDSKYEYGTLRKNNSQVFYAGNLLYAAIFSDKENYECNVQRLIFRTSKIAKIFSEKADLMNARGCNTNFKQSMESLAEVTSKANSDQLEDIYLISQSIGELKEFSREGCDLW
jgi:hypothetical protein